MAEYSVQQKIHQKLPLSLKAFTYLKHKFYGAKVIQMSYKGHDSEAAI